MTCCLIYSSNITFVQGLVSSTFEVVALCGFVFGVASKLPPSLTILLLNGVFPFAIAKHLFCPKGKCCFQTESCGSENTGRESTTCLKHILIPLLETIAFLMQLGALMAIPILLYVEDMYNDEYLTVLMIPVTLTVISVVWSSRKKKKLVGANSAEALDNIRMKSGNYTKLTYICTYVVNILFFNLVCFFRYSNNNEIYSNANKLSHLLCA